MDNTDATNNNTKAPFKRIRIIGKSNPYLITYKNKQTRIKKTVKGKFRYSSKYINTIEKYLNEKLNNVGVDGEVDVVEIFKYLKSLNLFEGNIQSLSDLGDIVLGKLIDKKVDQHNDKAKKYIETLLHMVRSYL